MISLFCKKFKKKVLFSGIIIAMLVAIFLLVFAGGNNYCLVQASGVESNTSNFTNLIVYVRFNDEEDFVDNLCNGVASIKDITNNNYSNAQYNVEDYYYRVSNGKVKMQTLYLWASDNSAIQLSHDRAYYIKNNGDNPVGYDDSTKASRMLDLKYDWSSAISDAISGGGKITDNNGIEYSISDLDKNGDGKVDSLTLIYNYSSEYSVENAGVLWNYQDFFNGVELTTNGTTITSGNYVQLTANYSNLYEDNDGKYFTNLQALIHEIGHIFGLKDLYQKNLSSPVYFMSAMAKAISPIPQFISAKEREVMGWLNSNNVVQIGSSGSYTLDVTKGLDQNNVVAYKLKVPSIDKTLYVEYRKFDGSQNKYDTQNKNIKNFGGENFVSENNLKSGLVCFLLNNGVKYPNNYSVTECNYTVVGGGSTKNNSALAVGESYNITSNLQIEVTNIANDQLTFSLTGTDIEHVHTIVHVPKKSATCQEYGNDEYWKCDDCGKYFDDENLIYEKTLSELTISKKPHTKVAYSGEPATCQKVGMTAGEKCSVCGEVFSGCVEIPKLAHVPSEWIIDKDATTEEVGQKHIECVNCGETLESATIDIRPSEKDDIDNSSEDKDPPQTGDGDQTGDNDQTGESGDNQTGGDSEGDQAGDNENNQPSDGDMEGEEGNNPSLDNKKPEKEETKNDKPNESSALVVCIILISISFVGGILLILLRKKK